MIKDLVHSIGVQRAFKTAQVTSDTNSTDVIDTQGYENVTFIFNIDTVAAADGTNTLTIKVQESDDSTFATGVVEVTAADPSRTLGTQLVINSTTMADKIKKFGVALGAKRYMRLVLDETGTIDVTLGAIAVLGGPRHAPVS